MKILLHGLNYAPEPIGIGKYSGEMVEFLASQGHEVRVITTPPYYPQWRIAEGYGGRRYRRETVTFDGLTVQVIRCPLWVPKRVTGITRLLHLASFAASSSIPAMWHAMRFRPDVVFSVEPALFGAPISLLAARVCGAKAWLHIQDFEVDAAFELGILKQRTLKKFVGWGESKLLRRFDRVSSISPRMIERAVDKGVDPKSTVSFPNWVDCGTMRPLESEAEHSTSGESTPSDSTSRHFGEVAGRQRRIDGAENVPSPSGSSGRARLRRQFGLPTDKCVALYAGNIGHKQGLDIIINAAMACVDRPEIHFVICGTGAAHQELKTLSSGLSNVQWLPVQPLDRFNAMMNCADIHLLPQRSDAADLVMPSKLTGMLSTGRPVVACASPGTQIASVVNGHGDVVPPDDVGAFADAICRLADDPMRRRRLGNAARRYALEHLSRDAILCQLVNDLASCCGITGATDLDTLQSRLPHDSTDHAATLPSESVATNFVPLDRPRSSEVASVTDRP